MIYLSSDGISIQTSFKQPTTYKQNLIRLLCRVQRLSFCFHLFNFLLLKKSYPKFLYQSWLNLQGSSWGSCTKIRTTATSWPGTPNGTRPTHLCAEERPVSGPTLMERLNLVIINDVTRLYKRTSKQKKVLYIVFIRS